MEELKIAVLGAGHGGHALTADMSLQGFYVNLYEHARFEKKNLDPIRKLGGIEIYPAPNAKVQLSRTGLAKIKGKITTDIAEAVKGVDIIMVVVPSFAHRTFFDLLIPHLEDGQIVMIHTGNWGALEFEKMFKERKVGKNVKICETNTLMFACRRYAYMKDLSRPATVMVSGFKKSVYLAALPAKDTKDVLQVVNNIYPQYIPATHVIETSSNNANIFHIPVMVCNAGILESRKGDFFFWKEGVSPRVADVFEAVDQERCEVLKALGVKTKSFLEIEHEMYGTSPESYYAMIQSTPQINTSHASKIFKEGFGDNPFRYRYLEEDVPFVMLPLASLGAALGISTPTMDALIQLSSKLSGVDYWKMGRTAETLGLAGLTREEIMKRILG